MSLKSWEPGELMVYFLVYQVAGLRPKSSWCFSLSPETEEDQCPSSNAQEGGGSSYLVFLFYSGLQVIGWPTHFREVNLLYSGHQFKCSLHLKHSHKTTRVFPKHSHTIPRVNFGQMSRYPLAHSRWHMKLLQKYLMV